MKKLGVKSRGRIFEIPKKDIERTIDFVINYDFKPISKEDLLYVS